MSRVGCRLRWSSSTTASKWKQRESGISSAIKGCSKARWRPRNFFGFGEEDIVVLAVTLMAGIARAHAFEQGNKRTAFESLWHFLRINGYDLAIGDSQPWADAVIALVEHRIGEEEFARALRPFVVER